VMAFLLLPGVYFFIFSLDGQELWTEFIPKFS
jgi:hypothetical protein